MHVLEADSFGGELVQFGSLALRMPESAQGRVEVIGHDEQDVRFLVRG
jgi:hypothetical protein